MKVAIYCRLSEEDRNKQFETDDSNSIQNQKAMLLQYAMEQGWEVYNIYSDDNYTGCCKRRNVLKASSRCRNYASVYERRRLVKPMYLHCNRNGFERLPILSVQRAC